MPRVCGICGKGTRWGHNVSHAHNLTPRRWRVNLHQVTTLINGKKKRLKVCTKCLRKVTNKTV